MFEQSLRVHVTLLRHSPLLSPFLISLCLAGFTHLAPTSSRRSRRLRCSPTTTCAGKQLMPCWPGRRRNRKDLQSLYGSLAVPAKRIRSFGQNDWVGHGNLMKPFWRSLPPGRLQTCRSCCTVHPDESVPKVLPFEQACAAQAADGADGLPLYGAAWPA